MGVAHNILGSRSTDAVFVHYTEVSLYEVGAHWYSKDQLFWKLTEKRAWLSAISVTLQFSDPKPTTLLQKNVCCSGSVSG